MKKFIMAGFLLTGIACFNTLSAQEVNNASAASTDYKTALGIRLSTNAPIISNAITVKHFIKPSTAIEGYVSFNNPLFGIGAMLELYKPLTTPGLQWYYGAGAYLGFGKTYDEAKGRDVNTNYFGAQGVIGLDYKFASVPINLSVDWKPELNLVSDINFEPAGIGVSVRYTFAK
jgi:hypothetical protein